MEKRRRAYLLKQNTKHLTHLLPHVCINAALSTIAYITTQKFLITFNSLNFTYIIVHSINL